MGVSLASGFTLGLAEADGDSSEEGFGVGELFRFFFLLDELGEGSGDGLGEDFFFDDALGVGVSVGVGLDADFFFDDEDFSGVADGFGVGDFSALDFFFVCFRGVGVGVGAKIFLSVVGKDSAAGARSAIVAPINPIAKSARAILIVRCIAG
ncbi:MAG TPA: hypothetical protein VE086_06255 [Chthoniobacterales bacterium]|nr:hypothetical protein [Chthoniobacterales bacterium]